MNVTLVEQVSPHRLSYAAFEQNVVRYDDGRWLVNLQQGSQVLEEFELLVACRGPEVGTLHHETLTLRIPLGVDEGEAGLPPEGWLGQHT